jgi:hypothetical protein
MASAAACASVLAVDEGTAESSALAGGPGVSDSLVRSRWATAWKQEAKWSFPPPRGMTGPFGVGMPCFGVKARFPGCEGLPK